MSRVLRIRPCRFLQLKSGLLKPFGVWTVRLKNSSCHQTKSPRWWSSFQMNVSSSHMVHNATKPCLWNIIAHQNNSAWCTLVLHIKNPISCLLRFMQLPEALLLHTSLANTRVVRITNVARFVTYIMCPRWRLRRYVLLLDVGQLPINSPKGIMMM